MISSYWVWFDIWIRSRVQQVFQIFFFLPGVCLCKSRAWINPSHGEFCCCLFINPTVSSSLFHMLCNILCQVSYAPAILMLTTEWDIFVSVIQVLFHILSFNSMPEACFADKQVEETGELEENPLKQILGLQVNIL